MLTVLLLVGLFVAPVFTLKAIAFIVGLLVIPVAIVFIATAPSIGAGILVGAIGLLILYLCGKIIFRLK